MTTVINNPGGEDSSGTGMVLGVIIGIILIVLFFVYGLPAIRGSSYAPEDKTTNVNVTLPGTGTTPAPSAAPAPSGGGTY